MATYQYPSIGPEGYKWKQSDIEPTLWQRRACGLEAVIGIEANNIRGHNDIFSSATVQLHSSKYTLSDLAEVTRCAWLKLRFDHPEVACFPGYDGESKCLIQYRAPQDHEEAKRWAEKTITVEASHRTPMEIRDDFATAREDTVSRSDAVAIHIAASVESESIPLEEKELRFLFHANHLFFDGISLRELVGTFFKALAQMLSSDSSRTPEHLAWENSAQNLSPAVIELMDPTQRISGPEFDETLRIMMGYMTQGLHNWGMDTLKLAEGVPKNLFCTLTNHESEEITRNVKQNIGSQYNVTHLAQIAMLLALFKIKPPIEKSPENQLFLCLSPINGRRFMVPRIAKHEKPYFPISQSNAAIMFENINDYYIPKEEQTREKLRETLTNGIKVVQAEYARELNRAHQLSASISLMETVAAVIVGSKDFHEGVTAPILTSDGITERYIHREYFADEISKKEKILTVNDVSFWLNQFASYASVRLSSFRDSARLSVDFNTRDYTVESMQLFLTDIADYMRVFAGNVGPTANGH